MILRSCCRSAFPLFTLLLSTLLLQTPSLAKKDKPRITYYQFEIPPAAPPFYFEDSDVTLILDLGGNVLRSENTGETWKPIADVPEGAGLDLVLHPYDHDVAYLWGKEETHWMTEDKGETWRSFEVKGRPVPFRPPFSFHVDDPGKVIVNVCTHMLGCHEMAYYTTDAFKTPAKTLRKDTRSCVFAKSTFQFQTGEGDEGDDRIVCVVKGKFSGPWSSRDNGLRVSDNYFEDEDEPELEEGRTVQGIINVAVVKSSIVAAASAKGTKELAMYVTNDGITWHRAIFPNDHKLEEDAYTILESTNYSIQVDVMTTTPLNAMGVLFTSNSNGTYFTRNVEHTNRNVRGLVDFEKITGIQGIVLVNVVDNWEEVERSPLAMKKLKSLISFDDGRTFKPLTTNDGDEIHLHSVTDMSNVGRVFSSQAPGLVMGVGNKGEYLKDYEECDTYVSDKAGTTWSRALEEAHKYEFGDKGAVLLAVYDEGPTKEMKYSLNHGHKWETVDLEEEIRAKVLTTTPDSTSLKFFMLATSGGGEALKHHAIVIDFAELHEDKCKKQDFEDWPARVDEDGNPTCVMGHKQFYRRRKWDADCFVDEEFKDPVPRFEKCACAKEDFECDSNFVPNEDRSKCIPAGSLDVPDDQCKEGDDTFKGPSGFRLIPGNECDRDAKGAVKLDADVERPCEDTTKPPVSGEIGRELTEFKADKFEEFFYLEASDVAAKKDETVVMRTNEHEVYITKDAGKTWKQILKEEEITAIYPHQYINDVVFFLTPGRKVFYSYNRGDTFGSFEAEADPTRDRLQILGFHQDYHDWLIWTGAVDCGSGSKGECHNVAYFSEDRGATWSHRLRYVNKCEFIKPEGRGGVKELLYCEQYEREELSGRLQLKWSDNWFASDTKAFDDIVDFATMSEFIVVAARNEDDKDALSCHASVDGQNFANAQFPPSLEVPREKAYTVLDSSTHAVFLHVTVNNHLDSEYGSLIKSNRNGTYYVMSLNGVNRDKRGYVDFEKMLGLEGVILVNQVDNIEEADKGASKQLKTLITHNDGAQWAPLRAPSKDADGHDYGCDPANTQKCSLHLHSYTERTDPRATFSSPSAIGLMMGVGNVGEYLTRKGEADTFITRDGGVTWLSVMKGRFMWEYGDQGSIIVIVEEGVATTLVYYTLDEGDTWTEYPFSDTPFTVAALSTVPSDKSRNFILWGKSKGSKIATINLDFTGLTDRKCELDEHRPEEGDYYLWKPKHPAQEDDCLLGHIKQYHRKKTDRKCFNGPSVKHEHAIVKNCQCTREDFECDYNYQLDKDGSCQLVPGLPEPDHSEVCRKDPKNKFYWLPTGYRRTPLDTCEGGKELEFISTKKACPGYGNELEEEERKKGLGGFSFFILVFVLPISIACAVGYFVWRYWDGKVGSIRLGDSGSAFDADKPWIAWPVMGVSAAVAVLGAIPMLLGSAWRGVSGMFSGGRRYTQRSDFARGGRYAVVDPDEDELLGDDDEDEV